MVVNIRPEVNDAYRINLEDFDAEAFAGGYVDIKPRRTYGDRIRIASARLHYTDDVIEVDNVSHTFAKLDRAILSWSLGIALPAANPEGMSPERLRAFEELDEELGPWLVANIDAYYESQKRPAPDTKGLGSASSQRSTRAQRGPAS